MTTLTFVTLKFSPCSPALTPTTTTRSPATLKSNPWSAALRCALLTLTREPLRGAGSSTCARKCSTSLRAASCTAGGAWAAVGCERVFLANPFKRYSSHKELRSLLKCDVFLYMLHEPSPFSLYHALNQARLTRATRAQTRTALQRTPFPRCCCPSTRRARACSPPPPPVAGQRPSPAGCRSSKSG